MFIQPLPSNKTPVPMRPFLIFLLAVFFSFPLRAALVTVWTQQLDFTGGYDLGYDLAADSLGNLYAAGTADNGADQDFILIKYDALSGNSVWTQLFNGGATDIAYGVAVDYSNYIYLAGDRNTGSYDDIFVIKYDQSGAVIWTQQLNTGYGDCAEDLEADSTGLYTTGHKGRNGTNDFFTVKFAFSNGQVIWTQCFRQPLDDQANEIRSDGNGFLYVTGDSHSGTDRDYVTVKYRADNGTAVWTQRYNGGFDDVPLGLAVDQGSSVYVTGARFNGVDNDFCTIKYTAGGSALWTRMYDAGVYEEPREACVDQWGYVYSTGRIQNGLFWDFFTMKYDADGNLQWTHQFDGGIGEDYARSCLVDQQGFLYISGRRQGSADLDIYTVKYLQPAYPPPSSFSALRTGPETATLSWQDRSPNESGYKLFRSADGTNYSLLALLAANSTYYSDDTLSGTGTYWYRLACTNQAGLSGFSAASCSYSSGQEMISGVYPNYLRANRPSCRIVLGEADTAEIRIYSLGGSLVKTFIRRAYNRGDYALWDGCLNDRGEQIASGTYFVCILGERVKGKYKLVIAR